MITKKQNNSIIQDFDDEADEETKFITPGPGAYLQQY
jgi:hypothetical protein